MTTAQSLSSSSILLPLLSPAPPFHRCIARSQLSDFQFSPKLPSITFSSHNFSKRSRTSPLRGINSNDPKESGFFDENGVVEDMDTYLNYLSLEYDSVWDTKPSWCQPWTITLTGTVIISLSWLILHSAIATGVVMTIIGAWWYIFLYSYPKAYSDMIEERRKRVTNGQEDTYGARKSQ
ncbi:uncharacterized protein LOC132052029 [Lycium ferocissimum]|uniref:uncharacterized protein LOC132052029 n=1 Tax=Lycium ferocissimum TaxID=112874 RepID=UPI00281569DA|nr:uncharacterized protein LOC132052029 [Lycium ferocissimum]